MVQSVCCHRRVAKTLAQLFCLITAEVKVPSAEFQHVLIQLELAQLQSGPGPTGDDKVKACGWVVEQPVECVGDDGCVRQVLKIIQNESNRMVNKGQTVYERFGNGRRIAVVARVKGGKG